MVFGLTQPGIELKSKVLVSDALSTDRELQVWLNQMSRKFFWEDYTFSKL